MYILELFTLMTFWWIVCCKNVSIIPVWSLRADAISPVKSTCVDVQGYTKVVVIIGKRCSIASVTVHTKIK